MEQDVIQTEKYRKNDNNKSSSVFCNKNLSHFSSLRNTIW